MKTPTRRDFLAGLAGGGLAAASSVAGAQEKPAEPFTLSPPPRGYGAEADRLTQAMQRTFWDGRAAQYRAPVRSAESVDSDARHNNGYVVWPSLLGFFALVEGEKTMRGKYAAQMREVFTGLEGYFDPAGHAYNAWLHFPGNNDKYYDDNAWLVEALVEAYEATKDNRYRDRAVEVTERFLAGGWDDSGKPGGMRWGTDPKVSGTGDYNSTLR